MFQPQTPTLSFRRRFAGQPGTWPKTAPFGMRWVEQAARYRSRICWHGKARIWWCFYVFSESSILRWFCWSILVQNRFWEISLEIWDFDAIFQDGNSCIWVIWTSRQWWKPESRVSQVQSQAWGVWLSWTNQHPLALPHRYIKQNGWVHHPRANMKNPTQRQTERFLAPKGSYTFDCQLNSNSVMSILDEWSLVRYGGIQMVIIWYIQIKQPRGYLSSVDIIRITCANLGRSWKWVNLSSAFMRRPPQQADFGPVRCQWTPATPRSCFMLPSRKRTGLQTTFWT